MQLLSKPIFLKWLVIILLLINAAVLAYLFIGVQPKKGKDRKRGGHEYFSQQLNLTPAQQRQYDSLRNNFFRSQKQRSDKIGLLKDSLYGQTKVAVIDTALVDSLTREISILQQELEKNTLYHFSELRRLCTPEQQLKFDTMVHKINRMMQRPFRGKSVKIRS